ncbi:hypothetical protein RCL1_007969 [Eukaryota sp. TZLM3-RCL]
MSVSFSHLPALRFLSIDPTSYCFDNLESNFPNLIHLWMKKVELLPCTFGTQHSLNYLEMDQCTITQVPDFISLFPALTSLVVLLKQYSEKFQLPSNVESLRIKASFPLVIEVVGPLNRLVTAAVYFDEFWFLTEEGVQFQADVEENQNCHFQYSAKE